MFVIIEHNKQFKAGKMLGFMTDRKTVNLNGQKLVIMPEIRYGSQAEKRELLTKLADLIKSHIPGTRIEIAHARDVEARLSAEQLHILLYSSLEVVCEGSLGTNSDNSRTFIQKY